MRAFPHSRIREAVDRILGYQVGEGGIVYSEGGSEESGNGLRREVTRRLSPFSQVLGIAGKVVLSEFAGRARGLSIRRLA